MSEQVVNDFSSGDNSNVNETNLEKSDPVLSLNDLKEDYEGMPPLEDIKPSTKPPTSPAKKPFVIEESASHLTNEDGWLDIIGSGDLKKKVLTPGKGIEHRPTRGSFVEIAVKLYLSDDTFVEEWTKSIFQGDSDLTQGLDLALALMEEEEEAEVLVPSRLAYGSIGNLPHIPPDSALKYNIKLLKVQDIIDEPLSVDTMFDIAQYKKDTGNFWFGRQDYSIAVHCYGRALHFLDEILDENKEGTHIEKIKQLKLNLHNNQALAQSNIGAIEASLKSLDLVLDIDPTNIKAVFRKAKALADLGKLATAISILEEALIASPNQKVLQNSLTDLKKRKKVELAKEKEIYQKMFQTKKNKPKKEEQDISSKMSYKWNFIVGSLVVVGGILTYKYLH